MYAIDTHELSKTYDRFIFWQGVPALDRLTIQVPEGKVFGYLGPNGAGKTTTLRVLLGLTRPTGGAGRILGKEIGHPEAKGRIGYLAENPSYYDHMRASEFLDYYAKIFRMPKKQRKKRISELLEYVGLEEHASTRLKGFSQGMKQRIGLAQACLNSPDLLLLDEPMTGLDPIGRKQFKQLIRKASREEGKTVFFCSHVLADVEEICDMVAIVARGRLLVTGPLEDLLLEERSVINAVDAPAELLSELSHSGCILEETDSGAILTVNSKKAPDIKARLEESGATCSQGETKKESLEEFFIRIVSESERERINNA